MALEMTLKRSKKPVYPTKTTINLAVDDKGENLSLIHICYYEPKRVHHRIRQHLQPRSLFGQVLVDHPVLG